MTMSITRKFSELFGGERAVCDITKIARAACNEGYAVVPVKPGTKVPMCTLTAAQAKRADKEAAEVAKAAGQRNWHAARHACGRAHAITEAKDAERIFGRLTKHHPDLNIAVEVGRSRVLVVDADTAAERESFCRLWAEQEGLEELAHAAPTVRSPGVIKDGVAVHADGGHYWFLLPEDVSFADTEVRAALPIGLGEAKAKLMFADAIVLVPPSVRDEGPYLMQSDIAPASDWMVEAVQLHVEGHRLRRSRTMERIHDGEDNITKWSAATPWEVLLGEDGWTTSNRPDNCGCTIWTRPGDWSSPKSATAHEPGCMLRDTEDGSLHVWTDNPPQHIAAYVAATGRKHLSKLQYIAWRDHDGDVAEAMRVIGLLAERGPEMTDDDIFAATEIKPKTTEAPGKDEASGTLPAAGEESSGDDEPAETSWIDQQLAGVPEVYRRDAKDAFKRLLARDAGQKVYQAYRAKVAGPGLKDRLRKSQLTTAELAAMPVTEPDWVIGDMLERGHLAMLAAPAKAGKTTLMGNLLRSLTTGQPFLGQFPVPRFDQPIYVVDIEMTQRQHTRWLQEMGIASDAITVQHLRGRVADFNITDEETRQIWVELLVEEGAKFLIVDPLAPALRAANLDEDKTGDTELWFAALKQLCAEADIPNAIVCHHMGHEGERARGSSNLLATPDALWTMHKDRNDDRFFKAIGRDVEVPESRLAFAGDSRRLVIETIGEAREGRGSNKPDPAQDQEKQTLVLDTIRGNPGIGVNELRERTELRKQDLPKIAEALEMLGLIDRVKDGQKVLHYIKGTQRVTEDD